MVVNFQLYIDSLENYNFQCELANPQRHFEHRLNVSALLQSLTDSSHLPAASMAQEISQKKAWNCCKGQNTRKPTVKQSLLDMTA